MRTVPATEARARLSRLVEQASTTHERFEITRNGSRAAVLLGADDYDAIMEAAAVLSDAKLVQDIGKGLRDLFQGAVHTAGQVEADMQTKRAKE